MRNLWNGWARAAIVVFGGLLSLQLSDEFDISKQIYLLVASLAVVGSVWSVYRQRQDDIIVLARPWLALSALVVAMLAISFPVALVNGTSITAWIRDAAAYALVAAAPWLAVDAAVSTTSGRLLALFAVASALSVLSFSVEWLERRRLADLPIDRITLPSFLLAAGFFALSWAKTEGTLGSRRWAWLMLGGLSLGLLLLTGTRSTTVLLAAPAAVGLLLLVHKGRARAAGLAGRAVLQISLAVLIVFIGQAAIRWSTETFQAPGSPQRPDMTDRFDTVEEIVTGADNSLRERQAQTGAAVRTFLAAPVFGSGPGFRFSWPNYAGEEVSTTTLDTGLVVLAKFGSLGAVLFVVLITTYVQFARMAWRSGGLTTESLLLVGYGAVLTAWLPLGWPLEDKGFGLAMILLLGALFASIRTTKPRAHVEAA